MPGGRCCGATKFELCRAGAAISKLGGLIRWREYLLEVGETAR